MSLKMTDLKEIDNSIDDIKTHEEILDLIEDVKKFGEKLKPYEFIEKDFIDVDKIEEIEPEVEIEEKENEIKKVKKKPKTKAKFKIKRRKKLKPNSDISEVETPEKKLKIKKQKPIKEHKAATFRIRFNEEGNLENKDFRKLRQKSDKESKIKQLAIVKKLTSIIKIKKGKAEETTPESADSKASKIKGIFGKLGGITGKLPIPGKEKKKEKTKEEK